MQQRRHDDMMMIAAIDKPERELCGKMPSALLTDPERT